MKKSHLIGVSCAAILNSISMSSYAITYNINGSLAGGAAIGTITTDGTIGQLNNANITEWNISVDVNGDGISQTTSSSDDYQSAFLFLPAGYSPLSATANSLIFDFDQDYPLYGGAGVPGIELRTYGVADYESGGFAFWGARSISTSGNSLYQGITLRETQAVWNNDIWGHDTTSYNSFTAYTGALEIASVSAVPVPAAVWLFSSGLLGLAGIARRKQVA